MEQENVEHFVIAALRAEGRHRTWPPLAAGQQDNRVATADSRNTFGLGVWAWLGSCTNYAGTHCCLAIPVVGGRLHVINYPNRLRQIDLNRNQTAAHITTHSSCSTSSTSSPAS